MIVSFKKAKKESIGAQIWSFEPDSSEPVTAFRLIIVILRKSYHSGHDHKCKKPLRHGARPPDPYRGGYFLFGGQRNANTLRPKKDQEFKGSGQGT